MVTQKGRDRHAIPCAVFDAAPAWVPTSFFFSCLCVRVPCVVGGVCPQANPIESDRSLLLKEGFQLLWALAMHSPLSLRDMAQGAGMYNTLVLHAHVYFVGGGGLLCFWLPLIVLF